MVKLQKIMFIVDNVTFSFENGETLTPEKLEAISKLSIYKTCIEEDFLPNLKKVKTIEEMKILISKHFPEGK